MKGALLQAHRGVSTDCPENTISAFRAAVRQGYDTIELDPKFTRDGACVILHDRTVDRTGRRKDGGPLPAVTAIGDMTLAQAREWEYGGWFAPEYRGEEIPLLSEALDLSRETGVPLKLDNVIESFAPDQKEKLFGEIRRAGLSEKIGLTCSTPDFVKTVAQVFPRATIHYDGPVSRDILEGIRGMTGGGELFVWLRYDNAATAWNRNPAADEALCALVHEYARLGVWILSGEEERDRAESVFRADIIETTGSLKPRAGRPRGI